ncbi:MAG: nucleotide exchange factor GrpE [Bacteroidales bacterium]|nr:nucleotide exchange factor GrpE [Bacteroidales bacterium]
MEENKKTDNTDNQDSEEQILETSEQNSVKENIDIKDKDTSNKKKSKLIKSKSEKLAEEKEELQHKLADVQDKYLRLFSEFDNYRKRTAKEKMDIISSASSSMITKLLPILDDIERADKAFETAADVEAIKTGSQLIFEKFKKVMMLSGLTEMDSTGKEFDSEIFEAIANFPAPNDEMKNKVIDTTEKGYLLNGKVIRHAKVVVGN